VQTPGTARDVSSLASYALGLACGVRLRFGWACQLPGWCAATSSALLSAACQDVGRSLQACRAAQMNRWPTSWPYLLLLAHWEGSGHLLNGVPVTLSGSCALCGRGQVEQDGGDAGGRL